AVWKAPDAPTTGVVMAEPKPEAVKLVLAGGRPGGGLALQLEAIAKAIMKGAPSYQVTNLPGSTVSVMKRMGAGRVDMAPASAPNAIIAASGGEPYGKPVAARAICATALHYAQFRVLAKTGITSVKDLIAKKYPLKFSVGPVHSNPETGVRAILSAYGITYKDIESWGGRVHFRPSSPGTAMMADGTADAIFYVSGVPDPKILELSRTRKLRMLPIAEPEVLNALEKAGLVKSAIRANTYNFVKEDIPTVQTDHLLLCRPDLPEEVVYQITKAIAMNTSYLSSVHKVFKSLTPKYMAECRRFVTLHPGAERFYREKGLL
ncbi:TAXI family TRAP transporter solute-binding subunit, partial [Thermodesulfobacteriota bacterium]